MISDVIVVFNMPPEILKIFRFTYINRKELEFFKSCHNKYVNTDEELEPNVLKFLTELSEGKHEKNEIYDDTSAQINFHSLNISDPTQIIVCGFPM
jgi:hypothetical protein